MELVLQQNIEFLSADFYRWLKDRYNIDMLELLAQRQSHHLSDLPLDAQPVFNTIDSLMNEITRIHKLVNKRAMKKLTKERNDLFFSVLRVYKENQRYMLDALGNMELNRNGEIYDDEKYKDGMKQRQVQLFVFANKLKEILNKRH
jgi:hypothetical protein